MRGSKKLLPIGLAFVLLAAISLATGQTRFSVNGAGPTVHGVPPSVTSFGFGGTPGVHGVPPSVTSLNFGRVSVFPGHGFRHKGGFRHRRRTGFVNPFFGNVVAVPYLVPYDVMEPGIDDSMEQEEQDYRGGPTIFDRRGPGTAEYRRLEPRRETQEDYRASESAQQQPAQEQQPVADQPETVLVFKDGHQQEVSNYAIVGSTLYDLSEGKTRRVALVELDLPATVKQNDSRGVDFRLPASAKAN